MLSSVQMIIGIIIDRLLVLKHLLALRHHQHQTMMCYRLIVMKEYC